MLKTARQLSGFQPAKGNKIIKRSFIMEKLIDHKEKRLFIIAEIGCNHNGDPAIAKKLINIAAEAGADAAKFQSFVPREMATQNTPKATYQQRATGTKESQYERLERLKLSREDHEKLIAHCDTKNILFCSSAFDSTSAVLLNELKVELYKIPSGEITNLPLLRQIADFGKPVILSTGMSDLAEIREALDAIGDENLDRVILMHCLSNYPASWQDANLRAIHTLKKAFGVPVGFSDHTLGIELSLAAVAMEAAVIEKHITLDKSMDGGDHRASLDPTEFRELVSKIRALEAALGDGIKCCKPSEYNTRDVARKSIVTIKPLKKGDRISEDTLSVKRPGTGIPPKYINQIIGCRALQSIAEDELIQWHQIDRRRIG
jgi:N,N'-diacetyllegionaminate synthase